VLNSLTAISPIDGRYFKTTEPLAAYFSEYALIRYRVHIEVEYFIALTGLPIPALSGFPKEKFPALRAIPRQFSEKDAANIKELEKTTNHDVKAVEYYLKAEFDKAGLGAFREFIHFGLTSQDINNTATPLLLKDFLDTLFLPEVNNLVGRLERHAATWKSEVMLARTHGQPASPTKLGKEISVFGERIRQQLALMKGIPHAAKFGGATGNFNASVVTYPQINWVEFANGFISGLGLSRSHPTTQIEHYDHLAALFDNVKRINTILIDYCRDMWQYVSMEYFKQKISSHEIGSSAMPHKVNPIDFENAEGNLGMANAILEHLSAKLPVSRLQRDLTDSTVLRNIGVPFAHSFIALKSLERGMERLELNSSAIRADLENNWAVVAEAIQTILRSEGFPNPFEALKGLTRKNEKISQETLARFIDDLAISDDLKKKLKGITPFNYTGV
jgi:adenylosuccinate lyase